MCRTWALPLVCADADQDAARAAADDLASLAWACKHDFVPAVTPLEDAIRIGLESDGLTVIGDPGDAPSAGSAADNAGVLRALLAAGADRSLRLSYLTLCDSAAAQAAAAAGVGATISLSVGHAETSDGEPFAITGTVRTITDGSFVMHDAGAQGSVMRFGITIVPAIGSRRLVLRSNPGFESDTGVFTSAGLDLRDAAIVFIKSPSHSGWPSPLMRHAF